ncbi:MAG: hypothetical protein WC898_00560 [Candidatus Paceibacterota bacterium]|jgi:hypothetical protein
MKERILIIDIGSSSIIGTLINADKKNTETIFSLKEKIMFENETNISILLSSTLKSLNNIINGIYNKHFTPPTKIYCILSSPWYVSELRNISLSRNTPFLFSIKLADEMLKKETSLFQEECYEKYGNLREGIFEPLELKTMKTVLNGYETHSPFGKKVTDLNISVFVSLSNRVILEKIRNTIRKYFHGMELKFFSSSFSLFVASRDLLREESFLMLDVGGDITEVSLIKKSELVATLSFPYGNNTLIREIAKNTESDLQHALSSFFLHKERHMNSTFHKKMDLLISEVRKNWLKEFELTLSQITKDISLPSGIILLGEPEFLDFFSSSIEMEQIHQYNWTTNKFHIVSLSRENTHTLYLRSLF